MYAGGVSEQLADTFLGWHRARLVCTLTLRSRCIIASYNDAFQEDYRHLSYKSISRLVCHAMVKSASEFRSANLETNSERHRDILIEKSAVDLFHHDIQRGKWLR